MQTIIHSYIQAYGPTFWQFKVSTSPHKHLFVKKIKCCHLQVLCSVGIPRIRLYTYRQADYFIDPFWKFRQEYLGKTIWMWIILMIIIIVIDWICITLFKVLECSQLCTHFLFSQIANAMVSTWQGPPAMKSLFTRMFCCKSCPNIVKTNNFINFQSYFLQKVRHTSKSEKAGDLRAPSSLEFLFLFQFIYFIVIL